MISLRKLCFLLLLLPIVLPLLIILLHNIVRIPGLFIFVASLFTAGIQYSLFAIGIACWWRKKPLNFIRRSSLLLPLLFLPIMLIGFVVISSKIISTNTILAIVAISITIGYFYVALAHLTLWLCLKTGLAKRPE